MPDLDLLDGITAVCQNLMVEAVVDGEDVLEGPLLHSAKQGKKSESVSLSLPPRVTRWGEEWGGWPTVSSIALNPKLQTLARNGVDSQPFPRYPFRV
jgi:hypothetical protein